MIKVRKWESCEKLVKGRKGGFKVGLSKSWLKSERECLKKLVKVRKRGFGKSWLKSERGGGLSKSWLKSDSSNIITTIIK